jgi:hypothetical protein
MIKLINIALLFILIGCMKDEKTQTILSPTKLYSIVASVNRTDKSQDNYALVMIHLFDKNGKEISMVNTNSSDAMKWAVGWTVFGDTIVLYSSDIGNKAWRIDNLQTIKIDVTAELDKRAKELKDEKYK